MSYDGITMAAVCHELQTKLAGARVDKIVQPRPLEIILHLRTRHANFMLVCSADSQIPRIHLTSIKPENPASAPAFCMLLRKHLSGARLLSVEQSGLERILLFHFRSFDDFGEETKKTLICEIMGKHSNIILTMPRNDEPFILGAVKNITEEMSRYRTVLPGEPYYPPPVQDKLELFSVTEETLAEKLAELPELPVERMLMSAVFGLGPVTAKEITQRVAGIDNPHPLEISRALTVELLELAAQVKSGSYQPCIMHKPGSKPLFSPILLTDLPSTDLELYTSVNECLDSFFNEQLRTRRENELRRQLLQVAAGAAARVQKKKVLQEKERKEMEEADRYRIWGELLTASLHQLHTGMQEASVIDYYSTDQQKIQIPLNPAYSPQENVQRYFKKYRKLKEGEKILRERLQETLEELSYLESLITSIEHADLESLLEIHEEMESAGLIRTRKNRKRAPDPTSLPLHFVSVDGIDIYVGKNNRQNDRLTLRDASPTDTWLHTKDIPGAHVIVKSNNPPDETLAEAARLAVRYSKAAASSNVPVDYTLVRHVRKPKGAKPGMVIYDHQRTLYITV